MPKRSSKDINSLAASIVDKATSEPGPVERKVREVLKTWPGTPEKRIVQPQDEPEAPPDKDPAAVALGRKGGLKGGKARAESLTPEQRAEIAKAAAAARWKKH